MMDNLKKFIEDSADTCRSLAFASLENRSIIADTLYDLIVEQFDPFDCTVLCVPGSQPNTFRIRVFYKQEAADPISHMETFIHVH